MRIEGTPQAVSSAQLLAPARLSARSATAQTAATRQPHPRLVRRRIVQTRWFGLATDSLHISQRIHIRFAGNAIRVEDRGRNLPTRRHLHRDTGSISSHPEHSGGATLLEQLAKN